MSLTETAAHLAEAGAANHDARSLMAAAEILRVAERGTPRVTRVGSPVGPSGPWGAAFTSAAVLRLASGIATDAGDWAAADYVAWLLQLPDSVPATRGAVGGPIWADAYLPAKKEASYTIDFAGGQSANLLQISAGKTDAQLECVLRETDGTDTTRPALRVRSIAGTCSIEWRQTTTRRVTLVLRNIGQATFFVLSSN